MKAHRKEDLSVQISKSLNVVFAVEFRKFPAIRCDKLFFYEKKKQIIPVI
jgi:hypothetical protein